MAKTKYVWHPVSDSILQEKDGIGATLATYEVEPVPFGRVISQRRGTQTRWYQHDGLGSTVALSDETGAPTDTYAYDAWGNEIASTGTTPNPYRYVGEQGYQTDPETGSISVRRRTYRPTIARWTSEDPLGDQSMDANLFRYSNSAPIGMVDPSGMAPLLPIGGSLIPVSLWTDTGLDFCDGLLHGFIRLRDGVGYGFYAESHLRPRPTLADDFKTVGIVPGVVRKGDEKTFPNAPCYSIFVDRCCMNIGCYIRQVEEWVRNDYRTYNLTTKNRRSYNVFVDNCYTWRDRAAGAYLGGGWYGPDLSRCRNWWCIGPGVYVLPVPDLVRR